VVFLRGVLFFIEEDVGIFVFLKLEITLQTFVLASKAVFLDSRIFTFFYELIIKAVPLIFGLNKRVVMSTL